MNNLVAVAEAAVGAAGMGVVPVFIWLAFWLFEDWRHPEPRRRLLMAFLTGMLAVVAVLPLQALANNYLTLGPLLLFIWALIEECTKLGLAWLLVLRHREVDEPIDFPTYMITVALGFAAVENTLFLYAPLMDGQLLNTAVTGDLRFIGATLIHILGSAIIGGALAFSFFRSPREKAWYVFWGVILATSLHTLFNLLIITAGASKVLTVFLGVWVGIVFILLALERIKLLRPPAWWERTFISK